MSFQERVDKYIKEHCKNCKNKHTDLCDIRISQLNGVLMTKCQFYENENPVKRKKLPHQFQNW